METPQGELGGGACIAARYEVRGLLGHGGMAVVYRAHDRVAGRAVALKLATVTDTNPEALEMFEREFHTLNQLAHPRVVRAFDYGLDQGRPYYTMELLDGGDLRARAPMPWPDACRMAHDVCAALSLLHSRRLLHRDLTPRNIHCTADGTAKLIDFGLLSPFGPASGVHGTPPYVAPEVLNCMSLDGRSDLFSLGTTLYQALTGRVAFPARRFHELRDYWRTTPVAPSSLVEGIPEALDALVLSLVRIDVEARPQAVAEVMERLRPLLPTPPAEEFQHARAHLVAPQLVGRAGEVVRARKLMMRAVRGRGGGFCVSGVPGSGRTRMLDCFALEAKLVGALTARAGAPEAALGPLGLVAALVAQLRQAAPLASLHAADSEPAAWDLLFGADTRISDEPPLRDLTRAQFGRAEAHAALRGWFARMARQQAIALLVDDIELADEPSAALLAALSLDARSQRLAYAITTTTAALEQPSQALSVLAEQAGSLVLQPLDEHRTGELLKRVFGDVPHLARLAQRLHALSGGRPRDCMTVAQHLVQTGAVTYAAGTWTLPESPEANWLPPSLEATLRATLADLGADATTLARAIALSVLGRASRKQLVTISGLTTLAVDRAIDELRGLQLISGNEDGYRLVSEEARGHVLCGLSAADATDLHERLADCYAHEGDWELLALRHRLEGSNPEAALARLLSLSDTAEARAAFVRTTVTRMGAVAGAAALKVALGCATRLGRPERDHFPLWDMLGDLAAKGAGLSLYDEVRGPWLSLLQRDSGFHDWHALKDVEDPGQRAVQAFVRASQRYEAESEDTRGLPPREAIRALSPFIGVSIVVAARSQDQALLASLPALLEPFAPLNPMVAFMHRNASNAVVAGQGRREEAYARYTALSPLVESLADENPVLAARLRSSGHLVRANFLAGLGVPLAELTTDSAPDEPAGQITQAYTEKIVALHRGDRQGADAHGQRAELLALEHRSSPLFATLNEELEAHALSRDLSGVKAVRRRIETMARMHPGWVGALSVADAYYHQLCGDLDAALLAAEQALASEKVNGMLVRSVVPAAAIAVEVLVARGQYETAVERGRAHLSDCEAEERHHLGRQIALALALAEAHLGELDSARSRVLSVQAQQEKLGVRGLLAGRTSEHLARIALLAGDAAGFEAAARDTAEHYRVGESSVLAALYGRLLEAAHGAGVVSPRTQLASQVEHDSASEYLVSTTMLSCQTADARARAALQLLCGSDTRRVGHLFLLTRAGLEHTASVDMPADIEALKALALTRLEYEQDSEVCTLTSFETEAPDASGVRASYRGADGREYAAVPLMGPGPEGLCLVGVAVLSKVEDDDPRAHELAGVVARHLIECGDYAPVLAG